MARWGYYPKRSEFVSDGLSWLRIRREYQYSGSTWQWVGDTRYVYDGMRVIQERDSSNTPTVSYSRGVDLSGSLEGAGGIGGLLARSHGYSGSTGDWSTHNFYHADGGGNVTCLISAGQSMTAQYRYDPFGRTTYLLGTMATANTYRFSSKEMHSFTGMYYYGYRFYDPLTQRWPNRDPINEQGLRTLLARASSRIRPDAANLYEFVYNSPPGYVDPDGLTGWSLNNPARWWDPNAPDLDPHYPAPSIPPGFLDCMNRCLDKFDPLHDSAKLCLLGLGPWPKPFVTPGSTPYTNVPRRFFGLKELGRSRLVKYVTIPAAIVYGGYLAGVEVSCAIQCGADPNAF